MRSMLVIGLGRFGSRLALRLAELHNEVMGVDVDEAVVEKLAPRLTAAQVGDCMNESVIDALGVTNFDVCFVCISENFQSSLEITSLLKDRGAKCVVSKADHDLHEKFLRKIGADDVVYPEHDMAARVGLRYSVRNVFDYMELSPDYAVAEMAPLDKWIGRSVADLGVRTKWQVNIIGIRDGEHITPLLDAAHVFASGEHLLVAGSKDTLAKIMTSA